jgi:hypothetical protein
MFKFGKELEIEIQEQKSSFWFESKGPFGDCQDHLEISEFFLFLAVKLLWYTFIEVFVEFLNMLYLTIFR